MRYLSANLSIVKMYTSFLEKYYPSDFSLLLEGEDPNTLKCEVRYHFFLRHFRNNYNYKFGLPRKDICVTCSELEANIELEN